MAVTPRVTLTDTPAVANSPVKPPVVADRAVAKVETANQAKTAPPKGFATAAAPVVPPIVQDESAKKEADFSGRGVRGGTSYSVAGGGDSTAALSGKVAGTLRAVDAVTPMRAVVTGIAEAREAELKVVRVDSTVFGKRTTYESLSGKEVVLTEQRASTELSEVIVTGVATEARKRVAPSPPPAARQPVAPAPTASTATAQGDSAVHSISWTGFLGLRRYTLSGPVSVEELEAIKARLLKTQK
jgi:hypothetical protein